jgi:uncharacterized protein (TIGR00304 family)
VADQILPNIAVFLILLGFAISFIAMLWLVLSNVRSGKDKVRGGGAIIIGPIPIIFGTDKETVKILLVLSIILVILLLFLTLFSSRVFQ